MKYPGFLLLNIHILTARKADNLTAIFEPIV
jgi:hypothetical protein